MDKKNIILQKIDGIYDIYPPVEPALNLLEKSLIGLSLILLIGFSLYFFWKFFYSNKAIAKRKVKELYNTHTTNNISHHDAIYQLCHITKQGLELNKLNQNTLLPNKLHSKNEQWQIFIDDINCLRYKKNKLSDTDVNKLFLDCLFWLKVWP